MHRTQNRGPGLGWQRLSRRRSIHAYIVRRESRIPPSCSWPLRTHKIYRRTLCVLADPECRCTAKPLSDVQTLAAQIVAIPACHTARQSVTVRDWGQAMIAAGSPTQAVPVAPGKVAPITGTDGGRTGDCPSYFVVLAPSNVCRQVSRRCWASCKRHWFKRRPGVEPWGDRGTGPGR